MAGPGPALRPARAKCQPPAPTAISLTPSTPSVSLGISYPFIHNFTPISVSCSLLMCLLLLAALEWRGEGQLAAQPQLGEKRLVNLTRIRPFHDK